MNVNATGYDYNTVYGCVCRNMKYKRYHGNSASFTLN